MCPISEIKLDGMFFLDIQNMIIFVGNNIFSMKKSVAYEVIAEFVTGFDELGRDAFLKQVNVSECASVRQPNIWVKKLFFFDTRLDLNL